MAQGPLEILDGMWSSLFKMIKKLRRRICSIFAYRTLAIRAHCRQVERQYVAYVENNFLVPEDFNITSSIWKYEKLDKWENVIRK